MNSTRLIALARKRFGQLTDKDYEWRSFFNGFLEGYAKRYNNKKYFVPLLFGISILNGLNDIYLSYNRSGEWNPDVFLYGVIHFVVFAGAFYVIINLTVNKGE